MKYAVALIFTFLLFSCGENTSQTGIGKSGEFEDSVSYAYGADVGGRLKNQMTELNEDSFLQGVRDGMSGNVTLTDNQLREIIMENHKRFMEQKQKENEAMKDVNLEKANEFLEKNKKESGVQVTESGLQYKVIKEGTGLQPSSTDRVRVNYEGKLLNGNVFDSSYKRGTPAEFGLNQVIKGWTEGLQLMKEGAKYTFYVHPNLGYGERGAGGVIGANELLIFDVELLKVL